jgi:DNA-binding response OmpR family regulator
MRARILVVAADTGLRASLARWLLGAGYGIELAESPKRAREVLAGEHIPLAIVEADGFGPGGGELVSDLAGSVGHIMLVGDPSASAAGYLEGMTDGCIAKPPQEQEVLARVNAALQPQANPEVRVESQFLNVAQFTIDLWGRECRNGAGEPVPLTRAEFSLLAAFARAPGRVLSRDELNQVVSGRGAEPEDNSVYVLISRLRRKIESDPKQPQLIVTVPGEGYKLNTPVQILAAKNETTVAAQNEAPTHGMRLSRRAAAAVIVLLAAAIGLGAWAAWNAGFLSIGPTQSPATASDQGREVVFTRMVAAMQDERFTWRTIERLAIEAGVSEQEAHGILAAHSNDVVIGKSRDGKLIARLRQR